MSLGLWGRFSLLAGSGLVLIVAVVVVACFLGPGCWGFEYLRRGEKKGKGKCLRQQGSPRGSRAHSVGCSWLEEGGYVVSETGPFVFETKASRVNEAPSRRPRERAFGVKCAPLLVTPALYSPSKVTAPRLEIKIAFSVRRGEQEEEEEEEDGGRLAVRILSATLLPPREYVSTLDPSVSVEILNSKWSLQKSERLVHAVATRIAKGTTNPTFDETFRFEGKKIEIKNWSLKLTILDNDRLTRATPLFERRIHLKELKNLTSGDEISFNLEMQEATSSAGGLFFGISYLPTAQRLNVCIIKAAKLKRHGSTQSLADFYPYVRVLMVDNHGKCVKKKRTCVRHGEENPAFNQNLVFNLSISNLEQTTFLVLLCDRTSRQNNSEDESSLEEDADASLREARDKVLGAVALGRNVRCTKARDHWVTVMQNPRKMISVWHDLK